MWNWNVIDACFIARSWHITSHGMFAGSCIGVILLVMCLEALRRAGKEYDRYLVRHYSAIAASHATVATSATHSDSDVAVKGDATAGPSCCVQNAGAATKTTFRPNILEHIIRSLIHMLTFAVAYFVMLLAMYYNGYIIICIFIGAFLGYFAFNYESITVGGPKEEVTVCCG